MVLSIILRKDVADIAEAQQLYELVCSKLADHPEVDINGNASEVLELPPPPP